MRPVRNLAMGEAGEITVTAQQKNAAGRWVVAERRRGAD
jgi:hypothetical protein